jgi:hypothetical protein
MAQTFITKPLVLAVILAICGCVKPTASGPDAGEHRLGASIPVGPGTFNNLPITFPNITAPICDAGLVWANGGPGTDGGCVAQAEGGGGGGGGSTFVDGGSIVAGVETLEQWGAVGNGVTSDQSALASALAVCGNNGDAGAGYGSIYLGANRTYLVTGGIIPANCSIVGQNSYNSLLKSTTGAPVLVFAGNGIGLHHFGITGSNSTGQVGVQNGTFDAGLSGFVDYVIEDVSFTSLPIGIDVEHTSDDTNTYLKGGQIHDSHFLNSGSNPDAGCLNFGVLAEYNSATNNEFFGCGIGVNNFGGNNTIQDNHFTLSSTWDVAIEGDNGATITNDAHGIVSGNLINHGGGIFVGHIANGETFSHNQIRGSTEIELFNSSFVSFTGDNTIDVATVELNGSQGTTIDGNHWVVTTPTITSSNSATTWIGPNNWREDGTFPTYLLAADDRTGWTFPILGNLELPRAPNATSLVTDSVGQVAYRPNSLSDLGGTLLLLDPAQGVTIATGVSSWTDQSGNAGNFTQSTGADQPAFTASDSSYNNQPTIGPFTASASGLASGNWSTPPPSSGTIVWVGSCTFGGFFFDGNSANRYAAIQNHPTLSVYWSSLLELSTQTVAGSDLNDVPMVLIEDLNGANTRAWVSAIPLTPEGQIQLYASSGAIGTNSATGMTIGNDDTFDSPCGGKVALVWVSSSRMAATAGGIQSIFSYVANRFGGSSLAALPQTVMRTLTTGTYAVNAGDSILANPTGGVVTLNPNPIPSGQGFCVKNIASAAHNVVVNPFTSGSHIESATSAGTLTTALTISTIGQSFCLKSDGTNLYYGLN